MASKLFFARVAVAAMSCSALTIAVGGAAEGAPAGSTTVSPAGAAAAAINQGPVVFKAGLVTVTCNTFTTTGSVPAAPNNHNPNGSVSLPIAAPTIKDCKTNLPALGEPIVSTSGAWSVSVQNGSPITGTLVIPQGGVTLQTSGTLKCTAVLSPNGPTTVPGGFTNGNPSTVKVTEAVVPIKASGDAACPRPTEGTVSATFALNNTTDPTQPITVGP